MNLDGRELKLDLSRAQQWPRSRFFARYVRQNDQEKPRTYTSTIMARVE